MSKWPTEKHFTSWLTLSPANDIAGGKVLQSKIKKTANRAAKTRRQATQSLQRSDTDLGDSYRRMGARLGVPKAIAATARMLACIIYVMLKDQKEYVGFGADCYINKNRGREIKKLIEKGDVPGFYVPPAARARSAF